MANINTTYHPQRGEIYFLDFKDTRGQAMRDRHPALVVQNNTTNRYSGLIIVVPLTTNLKVAQLPVGVAVNSPEGGMRKRSAVHCGQVHTIDHQEFFPERLCGRLSLTAMEEINKALQISLDLV